jgi:hypothetical protein
MRGGLRERALVWALPATALVLLATWAIFCVVVYLHFAQMDAAFPADGRGVLRARAPKVVAATELLSLTWITALPVTVAATLLASAAQDRFHAEGAARKFAQIATLIGVAGCIGGVVLVVLGFLSIFGT